MKIERVIEDIHGFVMLVRLDTNEELVYNQLLLFDRVLYQIDLPESQSFILPSQKNATIGFPVKVIGVLREAYKL